jgi:hypothetical protein
MRRLSVVLAVLAAVLVLAAPAVLAARVVSNASAVEPASCATPRWSDVDNPAAGRRGNLEAIAWRSSTDAWAVGYTTQGPLIERWDGTAWTVSPSPSIPEGALDGVSATAADDAWAVGGVEHGNFARPLVEHWDGSTWTRVAGPVGTSGLTDADALAPDDVWASGGGSSVFHWDGSTWTRRYHVPGKYSGLYSLAVLSPTQVWVVGNAGPSAVALHWDGSAWHTFVGPRPGSGIFSYFTSVAGLSPDDVWAVADNDDGYGTPATFNTFVYHFDGRRWQPTKPPSNPLGAELDSVAEQSSGDLLVTATDRHAYIGDGVGSLTWRRRGGKWRQVAAGRPGRRLLGLALDPSGTPWAVGSLGSGQGPNGFPNTTHPLIERYGC